MSGRTRDDLIAKVLEMVIEEVVRQDRKFGVQRHRGGNGSYEWSLIEERQKRLNDEAVAKDSLSWQGILYEEVAEAFASRTDDHYVEEMVQVAAVAVQAIVDTAARNLDYDVEGYE